MRLPWDVSWQVILPWFFSFVMAVWILPALWEHMSERLFFINCWSSYPVIGESMSRPRIKYSIKATFLNISNRDIVTAYFWVVKPRMLSGHAVKNTNLYYLKHFRHRIYNRTLILKQNRGSFYVLGVYTAYARKYAVFRTAYNGKWIVSETTYSRRGTGMS